MTLVRYIPITLEGGKIVYNKGNFSKKCRSEYNICRYYVDLVTYTVCSMIMNTVILF